MRDILIFLKNLLAYNRCNTCGFTKDKVYMTEQLLESGIYQCKTCINKEITPVTADRQRENEI